ncbi:hypothetical protein NQ315_012328 [Exocentrus adspersus]|uniref:Tyr recombinase domain-containing protein n=1 Tax=Exocentrus adspersus TaxID=1586481 RepID=A0AAV8V7Z8_9CUCU|nr:hypothetical protein NQ315_012328 [Exocentrus adspersus]
MNVPEAILKEAASVASSLLPEKSSSRYEREYRDFKNWQQKNGVNGVTEDVLLAYMNQLSARFSPNSLWSKWSMLKSCLEIKESVQIRSLLAGCNVENSSDILKAAQEASSSLLPAKSKEKYQKVYEKFCQWRITKNVQKTDENVILAYFFEKAKALKASSLWSTYSMLKSTLQINENMDISQYKNEKYARRGARGHHNRSSVVMGITGACRCDELTHLKIHNVEDKGNYLYVSLPDTKTKKSRSFTIIKEGLPVDPVDLCKKYIALRPKKVDHDRFFVFYKNDKCTSQCVGINTMSKIPSKIAAYLNLKNPEFYTGHCLRRASDTLLANEGANMTTLKRHGGWKSSTMAEGYLEDSIQNKMEIAEKIQGTTKPISLNKPSTSSQSMEPSCSTTIINENQEHFTVNSSKSMTFSFNINVNLNTCNSNNNK